MFWQFKFGGGEAIHTSGYDGSHSVCPTCPASSTCRVCPLCATVCAIISGAAINSNESNTCLADADNGIGDKLTGAVVVCTAAPAVVAAELPS
jgi:hypothetical protein